jgi:hypothetical protein
MKTRLALPALLAAALTFTFPVEQGEYVHGLKQGTWTMHSSASGRTWQVTYVDGREVR